MDGPETPTDDLYTKLGRTGLKTNRLVLGTVSFGGRLDEAASLALLDHGLEQGLNMIDTANLYGWRVYKGYTEELLGRWLSAASGRRNEVIVATKVGGPVASGHNDHGLSARHIVSACEDSLRRLQTDWIDLYQMHQPDPAAHPDEIWQAMEMLVAQGKVRYVGTSNFAGWQLAATMEAAARRSLLGPVTEQCLYNLAFRGAELEIIPAAEAYGVGVLVWSPLHGGMLGGVLDKMKTGEAVKSAQGRSAATLPMMTAQLEAFEQFCAEAGRPPAEMALSWVASQPGVTGVVIGPRSPAHIDDSVRALRTPLCDGESARLNEIFPPVGGGGPAPGCWIT